jgi:hypothetical protein
MKILERYPISEILKKPKINIPEAHLVWQLASIQQQIDSLRGAATEYLLVAEDRGKSKFDFVSDDEEAVRELSQKRARLFERYHRVSAAIFELDSIAEAAGIEPDIIVMNSKLKRLYAEITNAADDVGIPIEDKKAIYEKLSSIISSYKAILKDVDACGYEQ